MTTETLLNERKKELDKSKHDFKLIAIKYQQIKSKLVRNSKLYCSKVTVFLKCIDDFLCSNHTSVLYKTRLVCEDCDQ